MPLLLMTYWKQMLLTVLISVLGFLVYNHIYDSGYAAASTVYETRIKDYNDKLDKRIGNIETTSTLLVSAAASSAESRNQEMDAITVLAKKKPLYVVNAGKCTPSQDFLDSYDALILRANKK